jgi:hypothetical protein
MREPLSVYLGDLDVRGSEAAAGFLFSYSDLERQVRPGLYPACKDSTECLCLALESHGPA